MLKHDVDKSFQNTIELVDLFLDLVTGTMTSSWCLMRRSTESELP